MKSAHEQRICVGSSRLNSRMESSRNAREALSGSVASVTTHGTGALLGGLTAIALLVAGAGVSVSWGASARTHDTHTTAPARAEASAPSLSAGQKVAAGAGGSTSVPTAGWGVVGSTPAATDYTGSERTVPAVLWSAVVAHFPESERMHALHIAYCESRYRTDAVSAEGARGVFQIVERYHGPVPSDVDGQAAQAARVFKAHGWEAWDCA